MKKIILLPALALLTACGTSTEDKIVDLVKNNMKDPNSFELVKCEVVDTSRYSWKLQEQIDKFGDMRDFYNEQAVSNYSSAGQSGDYLWGQFYLKQGDDAAKEADRWSTRVDSLVQVRKSIIGTPNDTIYFIVHNVVCYGANSFGARVLNEVVVHEHPNGELEIKGTH